MQEGKSCSPAPPAEHGTKGSLFPLAAPRFDVALRPLGKHLLTPLPPAGLKKIGKLLGDMGRKALGSAAPRAQQQPMPATPDSPLECSRALVPYYPDGEFGDPRPSVTPSQSSDAGDKELQRRLAALEFD